MREEFTRRSGAEWDLLTAQLGVATKGEAELYRTKWFDYRRMHPMFATLKFAECYAEAHRHQYARRVDVYEARAMDLEAITSGVSWLAELWKGRRCADEHGIRYEEYCMFACDIAERSWTHLARPKDLSNSFLVKRASELWVEMLLAKIIYPEDSFYQMGQWIGHPDQLAWQKFVWEQIGVRNSSSLTLQWDAKKGDKAFIRQDQTLSLA